MSGAATAADRDRDRDRGSAVGSAVPRTGDRDDNRRFVPIPVYTGLGWWFPWYGFGSYGFGLYGPFGWSGYGYGDSYGDVWPSASPQSETGSIRLKVKPRTAAVYIDGALAGVAADFAGLSDHLDLEPGGYRLELRADGYETYQTDVLVSAGKTVTLRVTLRKQ